MKLHDDLHDQAEENLISCMMCQYLVGCDIRQAMKYENNSGVESAYCSQFARSQRKPKNKQLTDFFESLHQETK